MQLRFYIGFLQIRNILLHNPSGPAGHLPLHKGGFGASQLPAKL